MFYHYQFLNFDHSIINETQILPFLIKQFYHLSALPSTFPKRIVKCQLVLLLEFLDNNYSGFFLMKTGSKQGTKDNDTATFVSL